MLFSILLGGFIALWGISSTNGLITDNRWSCGIRILLSMTGFSFILTMPTEYRLRKSCTERCSQMTTKTETVDTKSVTTRRKSTLTEKSELVANLLAESELLSTLLGMK